MIYCLCSTVMIKKIQVQNGQVNFPQIIQQHDRTKIGAFAGLVFVIVPGRNVS